MTCGEGDEMKKERTHVSGEFGCGAFPSTSGVDVDHCLVEVDG